MNYVYTGQNASANNKREDKWNNTHTIIFFIKNKLIKCVINISTYEKIN